MLEHEKAVLINCIRVILKNVRTIDLEKCSFFPYINNEVDHDWAETFKSNIINLHHMILVKAYNDDIIKSLESCHFGFYKIGSYSEIEYLTESKLYRENWLGLRTLDESGRLHLKFANCTHVGFQKDEENFVENTLPFLTYEFD